MKWYDNLLDDVDFNGFFKCVFSIIMTVFMSLWGANAVLLVLNRLVVWFYALWGVDAALAKILAVVIAIVVICSVLIMGALALWSLFEIIIGCFIGLIVGTVVFLPMIHLIEKHSLQIDRIALWILNLGGANLTLETMVNSPLVGKMVLVIFLFPMYIITTMLNAAKSD